MELRLKALELLLEVLLECQKSWSGSHKRVHIVSCVVTPELQT